MGSSEIFSGGGSRAAFVTMANSLEQRRHSGSGIDPINRTEKVHLTDVGAIVTKDGVRYRDVEVFGIVICKR